LRYRDVGVDVDHADKVADKISSMLLPEGALKGHYAGLYDFNGKKLAIHTDGVGTKVIIAQALNKYDTVGIDAIAMNTNDLVCVGARPLFGVDYLAVARDEEWLIEAIIKGLKRGADKAKIAILGGETAVMPEVITGGKAPFDLAFTCVGVVEHHMAGAKRGDQIIGLRSSGIHSNGLTLARKVLGEDWFEDLLIPTEIYSSKIAELWKSVDVHAVAHITGSAYAKVKRVLPEGSTAEISLPGVDDQSIFGALESHVPPDEMIKTFNMGFGMLVFVDKEDVDQTLDFLKEFSPMVLGQVVESKDQAVIVEYGGKRYVL